MCQFWFGKSKIVPFSQNTIKGVFALLFRAHPDSVAPQKKPSRLEMAHAQYILAMRIRIALFQKSGKRLQ
ncbi:MAG: hypothetical protein CL867_11055 [Cytophagaceae bacterium]|nr:hypothetical protein [Cytophagaceae bacterium]